MQGMVLAGLVATVLLLSGCGQEAPTVVVREAPGRCVLDSMNSDSQATVHVKSGVVLFSGWAVSANNGAKGSMVDVVLKDAKGAVYSFSDYERVERKDVANAHKNEEYRHAGFVVKADLKDLSPGTYDVSLRVKRTGAEAICTLRKNLVIDAI